MTYCGKTKLDWIDTLAQVLRTHPTFDHTWHGREQFRYPLHSAVRESVMLAAPKDWHLLVLQWPHVSIKDTARLAYTRNAEHGFADRQTVTSIAKYIAEHFPTLASHTIRDICAKYGDHKFQISHDIEQMLAWLAESPSSCMVRRNWSGGWHPYRAYDPQYGWGLAVRLESGVPMARALVNERSKSFIRSFGAIENNRGHSQNDNALNSWLQAQGYEYQDSWSGLKLAKIQHPNGGWTAPYIDGDAQSVDDCGHYFKIVEHGDFECTNTDGHMNDDENDYSDCEDCGARIYMPDGEYYHVGRYQDRLVCYGCCDNDYVYAIGRHGDSYYVPNDDAIHVESMSRYYHDSFLSDNGIVYCEDTGDYEHRDDALYLDQRDEWVSSDCTYAVYCERSSTYEHIDDCVLLDDGEYVLRDNTESEAAA